MSTGEETKELSAVMDQLVENTNGEKVTLGDLLDALDTRSYGPLLLTVALIAISPIGWLPGVSFITAALILILSGQMLFGRAHPWLPKKLLQFEFKRKRLQNSVDEGRPWADWLEKGVRHRLSLFTRGPALIGVALMSIVLAVTFFPLALVPFGVFVPGAAMALLALGITMRDGLLVIFGYAVAAAAMTLLIVYWPF